MTAAENLPTELTVGYRMTAAGASAQGTLPLSTLVADVIQVATIMPTLSESDIPGL